MKIEDIKNFTTRLYMYNNINILHKNFTSSDIEFCITKN